MSIAENLKLIQTHISEHMDLSCVKIVAAAKFQTIGTIQEAFEAGIRDFGVNYAQEGEKFREELKHLPIQWHFIGHIQSRKIKQLVGYNLIQSMDRFELLEELNKRAEVLSETKDVLIEINIGEEAQKSGILKADLPIILSKAKQLAHINVKGLMAMPPALYPIEERLPYFDSLHALFRESGFDSQNHFLSMGTSEDYALAVKAGSNMVRLGTCLLGKRPTS